MTSRSLSGIIHAAACLTLSCSMLVAPMMVEVTCHFCLHQASASSVAVIPCFLATAAYSATACLARLLVYRSMYPAQGGSSRPPSTLLNALSPPLLLLRPSCADAGILSRGLLGHACSLYDIKTRCPGKSAVSCPPILCH